MTTSTPGPRGPIPPPASTSGGDGARGSPPPAFTAAALVLVIAGAVAIASRAAPVWTELRAGPANREAIVAGIAVLWGLGLVAAALVASVAHRAVVARRAEAPPLRTTLIRALPATTAALTALSLLAIAGGGRAGRAAAGGSTIAVERSSRLGELLDIIGWFASPVRAGPGLPDEAVPGVAALESGAGSALLLLGVVAFAVLVAAAAAMRWSSSSRSFSVAPPSGGGRRADTDRRAVREVLTDTIDAMLADPDPNTAIIGAYARLLEGLDACGAGRRDHEGPVEHLRRVLTVLDVRPEPLRQLITLFELARFSTHPLTAAHREQALDALRATAADLGAAAPAAVIPKPSPAGAPQ